MSASAELTESAVPDHVPPELVKAFDFFSDPLYASDPFGMIRTISDGAPIFYTPAHYQKAGSWVLTRAEDIRFVWQNPELFSSYNYVNFNALIGENWLLTPVEIDPPLHGVFRNFLNPAFSPNRLKLLDGEIRDTAHRLIDRFAARGECEFVSDFAQPFPVSIFLKLMGLPTENLYECVGWAKGALSNHDLDLVRSSLRSMADYLRGEVRKRQKAPTDDLISQILTIDVQGRPINDDEIMGVVILMFLGGLDTVTSSFGFHYNFLATRLDIQQELRDDRGKIPAAIEELLRMFAIVQAQRFATEDVEIAGVHIRKGDWITLPPSSADTDPREFEHPHSFDPARSNTRHMAFGFGPHRCLGSHLARREFLTAMNAWFDRTPLFTVKPGTRAKTHGGAIFGVSNLQLVWSS
jgi:cytochrome P450